MHLTFGKPWNNARVGRVRRLASRFESGSGARYTSATRRRQARGISERKNLDVSSLCVCFKNIVRERLRRVAMGRC